VLEFEPKLQTLRKSEYVSIKIDSGDGRLFVASYSTKGNMQVESIINLCRTLFICIVLSLASIYFTRDSQHFVLDPLERMIEKIKLLS